MTQRILVVEPDSHHRLIVEVMIKRAGFEVIACSTGGEAMARMGKFDINLVIAEIDLDGMTGLELCQNIKSNSKWSDIPFIFLTRRKNLHERVRAIQLGVENFLVKPVYVRELISRVQMLLREQEVASVTKKELRDQYEGRLSEALLIDIIRSLENRKANGAIELYRENRSGTIWLEQGNIIDAQTGSLLGNEAVYRLLLWRTGKFLIRFFPVARPPRIHKSNEDLIYEGLRRLDEWSRITTTLPGLLGVHLLDILEHAEGNEIPAGVDKLLDFLAPQTQTIEVVPESAEPPRASPEEALNILASHTVEIIAPIDTESDDIVMDSGETTTNLDEEEQIETFVSTEEPETTNLHTTAESTERPEDKGITVPPLNNDHLDHVSSVVDFLNRPLDEVGSLWAQEAQKDFDLSGILPSAEDIKQLRDRLGGSSQAIQPPDQQSVASFAAKVESSLSDEEEKILNSLSNTEAEKYNQPWEEKLEEILDTSSGAEESGERSLEELEEWNVLTPKVKRDREPDAKPITPEGMSEVFEPSFAQPPEPKDDMSPDLPDQPVESDADIKDPALHAAPTVLMNAAPEPEPAVEEEPAAPAEPSTIDEQEIPETEPVDSSAEEIPQAIEEQQPPEEPAPAEEPEPVAAQVEPPRTAADASEETDIPESYKEVEPEEVSPEPVPAEDVSTEPELPEPPVIPPEEMPLEQPPVPVAETAEPAAVEQEPPSQPPEEEPPAVMEPPAEPEPQPVVQEAPVVEAAPQEPEAIQPADATPKEETPVEQPAVVEAPSATSAPEPPQEPAPEPPVAKEVQDPLLAPAPPAPEGEEEEDYFGEPTRNWFKTIAAVVVIAGVIAAILYGVIPGLTGNGNGSAITEESQKATAEPEKQAPVALPDFNLDDPSGETAVPAPAAEEPEPKAAPSEDDTDVALEDIPLVAPKTQEVEQKKVSAKPAAKKAVAVKPRKKKPAARKQAEEKPPKETEPKQAAPASIKSLIKKGRKLLSSRKYAQAENAFREAASIAPGSPEPHHWIGELYIKQGNMSKARDAFTKATKKKRNYAPSWKRLGYVNEYLGDLTAAKKAYKTFLKYRPKGKEARDVRAILKEL